jgi:hypothetical protein
VEEEEVEEPPPKTKGNPPPEYDDEEDIHTAIRRMKANKREAFMDSLSVEDF